MEKLVKRGFIFIIIILPLLMYLAYLIPQNITFNPANEMTLKPLTPLTEAQPEPDVKTYIFDVSGRDYACNTLYVQSKHSEVEVTSNGELIYSLERGKKSWMNSTGTVYDLVYLPQEIEQIEVTVHNLYPNISSNRAMVSIGNGATIFKDLTRNSFFPTIISITEIFIGLLLLIFWYFFRRQGQSQMTLFYLALFSIAVGTWTISAGVNLLLIIENQAAASETSFIALMFFIVPFIQFTKYYFGYHPRFADAVSISAIIATVVMTALHMLGIVGFKQSLLVTHIHIAVIAVFYIYCFTRYILSGKESRRKYLNIIASGILMGSTAMDFIIYFLGNMQLTSAGRFGFIIYFFILGLETLSDMVSHLQESRKAAIYKELAYTDNLTGLYNRNAYIEWEMTADAPGAVSIINFDLNDLKKCNDTYGHVNGDKYITDSARIIQDTFGKYGNCYRIGGDEFAVVVDASYSEKQIEELLKELEKQQTAYNETSEIVQMHMAYGFAKYDLKTDESLESVSKKADDRMYEHKRALKAMTDDSIR